MTAPIHARLPPAGPVTAPSGEALVAALGSHARTSRLGAGLRLVEVREPYDLDDAARRLVADTLPRLRPPLPAADDERPVLPRPDPLDRPGLLDVLDGMLVIVGGQVDVRGWILYAMLSVHRRPVLWLYDAAATRGPGGVDLVRRAMGRCIVREWRRHWCPRRWYVAGLTNRAHLADLRSLVPGNRSGQPAGRAGSGVPCSRELAAIAEALGSWTLAARSQHGLAPQATYDAGARTVRDAFGGPADRACPGHATTLCPDDASLVVVRSPLGRPLRTRAAARAGGPGL